MITANPLSEELNGTICQVCFRDLEEDSDEGMFESQCERMETCAVAPAEQISV